MFKINDWQLYIAGLVCCFTGGVVISANPFVGLILIGIGIVACWQGMQ